MSELKIVKYPHPALRFQSKPLQAIDKEVRLMAGQMLELMYGARGLGLAGNQVAWPFQLFVMNATANHEIVEQQRVLINPVIVERKGTIEGDEGCLSFPDLYQKVRRAKTVRVQAYDLEGKVIEIVTSELPQTIAELSSRLMQHEIDHLHGILYIDKMGPLGKLSARGSLRDLERRVPQGAGEGRIPVRRRDREALAGADGGERDAADHVIYRFARNDESNGEGIMRLVMMGTGTFAEPTFEALLSGPHPVVGLVTQPDRAVGQERGSTRQTGKGMKAIAQEKGIPVFQPESINTPEGVAKLKEWQRRAARRRRLRTDSVEGRAGGGAARRHQRPCVAAAEVPRGRAGRVGHLPRRDAHRRDDHPHDDGPRRRRHAGAGGD